MQWAFTGYPFPPSGYAELILIEYHEPSDVKVSCTALRPVFWLPYFLSPFNFACGFEAFHFHPCINQCFSVLNYRIDLASAG
jgi:hypothetical protein